MLLSTYAHRHSAYGKLVPHLLFLLTPLNLARHPLVSALNDDLGGPGLAWPNALWVPMGGFTSASTQISSYYSWSAYPVIPPSNSSEIWDVPFPFIPMLWGCTHDSVQPFLDQLNAAKPFSGVKLTPQKAVLGLNEPDHLQQAWCTPQQAASVWIEVLEPLKARGYRLGSPSVTSGPGGRAWMREWYKACKGRCNPDFLALHWYDLVPQNFIEHLQNYHYTYNLPVWVTEYAPQNFSVFNPSTGNYDGQATYVEVQRFMDITTAYMKSVDWVERWFWFGAMYEMQGVNELDCLFDASGKANRTGALNDLGVRYAGANGSVAVDQGNGDHRHWTSAAPRTTVAWPNFKNRSAFDGRAKHMIGIVFT